MGKQDPVIERVRVPSAELIEAFQRLLPQLSTEAHLHVKEKLDRVLDAETNHLLVARLEGMIVGSLTLVLFHIPTGTRAWIEDVVVDAAFRKKGIGSALVRAGLDTAVALGAQGVDLTSHSSRSAANRLYRELGFTARETNVYRLQIDSPNEGQGEGLLT